MLISDYVLANILVYVTILHLNVLSVVANSTLVIMQYNLNNQTVKGGEGEKEEKHTG